MKVDPNVLLAAGFILNTIVVGGTGLAFVVRLGAKLNALSESVNLLRGYLERVEGEHSRQLLDHERRISMIEGGASG